MAQECLSFPEKSSWRWNEQACQGEVKSALSQGVDTALLFPHIWCLFYVVLLLRNTEITTFVCLHFPPHFCYPLDSAKVRQNDDTISDLP